MVVCDVEDVAGSEEHPLPPVFFCSTCCISALAEPFVIGRIQ